VTFLDKGFHFLEKLIQHHLSDTVQHPLPHTCDQSSDPRVRAILEHRVPVVLFQIYRYIPLHETRPAGTFAAQNIVTRWLLILDRDLSFISSFNGSDADLHDRFVLIRSDGAHGLAAGDTLGHNLRIE
jgi:hypothetical protein